MMNACMKAIRLGRIPVITSALNPAVLAAQAIPSLEEVLASEPEPERAVVHITAPESGDFRSFLRGTATVLMNRAGFRNQFPGVVLLEVPDAGLLAEGSMLPALIELLRRMSTGRTLIVGRDEDARCLTAAAGRFAIPALIQEAPPLKITMEMQLTEAISKREMRCTGRGTKDRLIAVAKELENARCPMFEIGILLDALSEGRKTITGDDLERELSRGGYIAMCKALTNDGMKKKPEKRMGFQSRTAENRKENLSYVA